MESMEKRRLPRFMIAAERSGQGKTMITCALLSILAEAGRDVRSFKCGPDYIDPMFHKQVLGTPSYNLDSFFSTEEELRYLLGRHGEAETPEHAGTAEYAGAPQSLSDRQLGVIEGVMGYYDGLGGTSERASSYETAKLTGTPVVLLLDCAGRSFSVTAALRGYLSHRKDSQIRGVIFNRLSPMLYPGLKAAVEQELGEEYGIVVAGYVPELKEFSLKSRHLGLVMPEEIPEFRGEIQKLAEAVRPGIDVEALFSIAEEAEPLDWRPEAVPYVEGAPAIAVAMDEAFCFYYQDNLDALERMGAKLVHFSPLHDRNLPAMADGLYLGGGYPELYGRELSENASMRDSIKNAVEAGLPCLAECGGFLYLKESLFDSDGQKWPMAGVLFGSSADAGRLTRFGYGTVTVKQDGILGTAGTSFPAHEFHHWDSEDNGTALCFQKPVGTRSWDCGFVTETLYAGFPHLYFPGHYPRAFLQKAVEWKRKRKREQEKP